jgi:hypothetical protein
MPTAPLAVGKPDPQEETQVVKEQAPVRPAVKRVVDAEDLTRDELRQLAKATRKLTHLESAQSDSGRRTIKDIERHRLERLESLSLAARLAETMSLARARGEEVRSERVRIAVPLIDEHGARVVRRGLPAYRAETATRVRIVSRGGLQLAFERGDLDGGLTKAERLVETGQAYRWAYEASVALATPQRTLSPVSSRTAVRASDGPQEQVFRAGELLRRFRHGLSVRQVAVLDRVCGLDMTVRTAAVSLKADPRSARKALLEGLTLAEANRRASRRPDQVTDGARVRFSDFA